MLQQLIIAEKQSIADSIKAALIPNAKKEDGYYIQDNVIISWARGHIIKLADDDVYTNSKQWNMSYLPILPKPFIYQEQEDTKHYIRRLKNLFKNNPIIINACDNDREGEVIFGLLLEFFGYNYLSSDKKLYRMCFSSVHENELQKAYNNLQPLKDFLPKFYAGKARLLSDWLVGINATQCFTLMNQSGLLTLGRVQTPLLKMICERFIEFKNHKETFTYKIQLLHSNGVKTSSIVFDTIEEAQTIINSLKNESVVESFTNTEAKEYGPKLYNLSEIQKDASVLYNYEPDEVLATLQELYEKKITSYPRTEDPFITEDMFNSNHRMYIDYAKNILSFFNSPVESKGIDFNAISKHAVCKDEELKGHHALVFNGIDYDFNTLSDKEKNIIQLISYRILQSFALPEICVKQKLVVNNNDTLFACNARISKFKGYKFYVPNSNNSSEEGEEENNTIIPNLAEGSKLIVSDKSIQNIKSKPKPLFTTKTLLAAMETAGNKVDISFKKVMKDKGLGRPAVRDGIIKKLYDNQYIQKNKNAIIPTELGLKIYNAVGKLLISDIELTCRVEENISFIEDNTLSFKEYMDKIEMLTKQIFNDIINVKSVISNATDISCPLCTNGKIRITPIAASCDKYSKDNDNSCKFVIFKNQFNKNISDTELLNLLKNGKTNLIKGFKNKDKTKTFDGYLTYDKNSNKVNINFKNNK